MISTRLAVPTVAGALALALGLTACGSADEAGAADSSGPIKIGVVVPLTGPSSPLGTGDKAAIEQEVKAINDAGGVLGRDLEVTIKDDKSDVPQSVTEFNQLAADRELQRDPLLFVRLRLDGCRDRARRATRSPRSRSGR